MKLLLKELAKLTADRPDSIALEGTHVRLSYQALSAEIEKLSQSLAFKNIKRLALVMDNGPLWVVTDLACQKQDITLIPLPAFFTPKQMLHAVEDAKADALLTDNYEMLTLISSDYKATPFKNILGTGVWFVDVPCVEKEKLEDIAKVTYTSGTTGAPKGVCLSQKVMDEVAKSLKDAIKLDQNDRHLCLLPLAVLLENIGGVYSSLLAGGHCIVPSLNEVGVLGASKLDIKKLLNVINKYQATTVILLPQMLQAALEAAEQGVLLPKSLKFIAVGGAPVAPLLLKRAKEAGLPVYEGYGLSECSSVVAVNTPENNKLGSVGKVLPHVSVTISQDGEILLSDNLFSGYLNHEHNEPTCLTSGDLGYVDDEGYLFITGRKKNCFITSYGRNVAPEWVERELTLSTKITQAVVFGEARPFNVAVVVANASVNDIEISEAIEEANARLPDYAQISAWLRADEAFTLQNNQMTATARAKRDQIWSVYQERINTLYLNVGIGHERSSYGVL